MYCKNCGKQIPNGMKELCDDCEGLFKTSVIEDGESQKFEVVQEVQNNSSDNSYSTNNNYDTSYQNNTQKAQYFNNAKQKSKVAAGILGLLFGSLGVHNFYLGYTGKAVAQLLMTILSCGLLTPISALWGFIEAILILTGDISTDANGVSLRE